MLNQTLGYSTYSLKSPKAPALRRIGGRVPTVVSLIVQSILQTAHRFSTPDSHYMKCDMSNLKTR